MANILIAVAGLPYSGRHAWAERWREERPDDRVVVSYDTLASMMGRPRTTKKDTIIYELVDKTAYLCSCPNGFDMAYVGDAILPGVVDKLEQTARDNKMRFKVVFVDKDPKACLKNASKSSKIQKEKEAARARVEAVQDYYKLFKERVKNGDFKNIDTIQ